MRLVSAYKRYLILLLVTIGLNTAQAQVWSLEQCIDTAQVYNKTLQISRNNIAIGEQKQKEAKANLIPKITASADYKYFINLPYQFMPLSTFNPAAQEGEFKEAQFGVPHNINASVQLSMPLYNPQVYGAIEMTKIAGEITDLQYQKSEEQLFFDITNLYYNGQILHHQLTFIDSNLINSTRLLKNMQLLKEQLMVKGSDVSKVQLQVDQLGSQKTLIHSKYEQIMNALKFAMGVSIDQPVQIDPTIQYQSETDYTTSSTLDIRLAKKQNHLLTSELNTLHKSRYLPSMNLMGSYGANGFGYDKQPNGFLKFYPVGFAAIQLSYPLFNGTTTIKKINQKKIELQNNELQISLLTEQNTMQVENAHLQRAITRKSVETTLEQIKLAQTIYDQILLQQKMGTATLTDVLLADNALREAQQTYLAVVIDYLKADLELKKITGNMSTTKL